MKNSVIWGRGWSHYEVVRSTKEYFVWSSGENWIHVLNQEVTKIELVFDKSPLSPATELEVTGRSGKTVKVPVTAGCNTVQFELQGLNDIRIKVSTFTVPNDKRSLGICMKALNYWIGNTKKTPRLDEIRMRMPFPVETRSISEQTNGKTQLINLPYGPSTLFFNSSIFEKNGEPFLLATRNDNPDHPKYRRHWDATLHLFRLDQSFQPTEPINMNIPCDVSKEQYFDARIVTYNNRSLISVNAIDKVTEKCRVKLIWLDEKFQFQEVITPKYEEDREHKNWTWFVHENSLLAIIRPKPYTVVEFDVKGNPLRERIHGEVDWMYGEARGGSTPVLFNGVYHSFFHSDLLQNWDGIRIYFMGHFTFNSKPPFDILSVDKTPILSGNLKDKVRDDLLRDRVVFPMGAIAKHGNLYVSLGLNDNETHLLEYRP